MARKGKKWEQERWYRCPKRNMLVVPPHVCNSECGQPKPECEPIDRRVKKRAV